MSDNTPAVQITKRDEQTYGVVLPFTDTQFKDFLKELLGQPRTLERKFLAPFVLERTTVGHLHSLIDERIRQQNAGHLVAFHAKLALADGTATTINSIEELLIYHELRSSSPIWLTIIWTYLITFADKNHPEKQEIEISFDTGEGTAYKRKSLSRSGEASINLELRHTARTFGLDLLALLGPELEKLAVKISPSREFLKNSSGPISFMSFLMVLAGCVWTAVRYWRQS